MEEGWGNLRVNDWSGLRTEVFEGVTSGEGSDEWELVQKTTVKQSRSTPGCTLTVSATPAMTRTVSKSFQALQLLNKRTEVRHKDGTA